MEVAHDVWEVPGQEELLLRLGHQGEKMLGSLVGGGGMGGVLRLDPIILGLVVDVQDVQDAQGKLRRRKGTALHSRMDYEMLLIRLCQASFGNCA